MVRVYQKEADGRRKEETDFPFSIYHFGFFICGQTAMLNDLTGYSFEWTDGPHSSNGWASAEHPNRK
jgi:hypothetical protein